MVATTEGVCSDFIDKQSDTQAPSGKPGGAFLLHTNGTVAQLVEHLAEDQGVGDSISSRTTNAPVVQLVERHLAKVKVTSSRLVWCSR